MYSVFFLISKFLKFANLKKKSIHKNKHRNKANQNIVLEKWEGDFMKEAGGWHAAVEDRATEGRNPKSTPVPYYSAWYYEGEKTRTYQRSW